MKEVTGELNMTLIVAISIGILAAFFFGIVWPMLNHNFQSEANCKSATCNCKEEIREANNGKCCCWISKNTENPGDNVGSCSSDGLFTCPFGG